MSAVVRLSALKVLRNRIQSASLLTRALSTSEKKRETGTALGDHVPISPTTPYDTSKLDAELKKNWQSYGFEHHDEQADRTQTRASFFFCVTLCLVWGGFYMAYLPDYRMRDWAQREAYLEVRRREALGLPYVNKDYADPANFPLPSDEELGDTEIII
ncbi:NADH dehydrogenase [ubiquinone] 1 beta subcomplex subunit 11, mitochondrial [Phlebotomus argentipes]|uniref:NADH dehydrogenase [ubiquinone] 1 beta subcomplex subunit 11, mitochondrial n=1 Tax=Phlebotomus argentipes TaxID=94469 RepID=UPI002893307F|nr:NADH dehydrogenase [ubiquinone] 1 beta subcomplex subunit 11, mitochondrial [Phlebotomus argentipes]